MAAHKPLTMSNPNDRMTHQRTEAARRDDERGKGGISDRPSKRSSEYSPAKARGRQRNGRAR